MILRKRILTIGLFFLLILTSTIAAANTKGIDNDALPPALNSFKQNYDLKIASTFAAPSGLTGYLGTADGNLIVLYVTEDEKHVIVGTLYDERGNNLYQEKIEDTIWSFLETSEWALDGEKDAPHIVYEFKDPNCPYCHKFWEDSQPWVKAGKVQVRAIMVGFLTPTSFDKAVAILAADERSQALKDNEENYSQDGGSVKLLKKNPSNVATMVEANNNLMASLGFSATPTVIYKDKSGKMRLIQGAPQGEELIRAMGGDQP